MSKSGSVVTLPERVDISMVSEVYLTLSVALETDKDISVDASAVERIDASGLQLLLAFMLQTSKQSLKCLWVNPSVALVKSARLLGLDRQLLLPEDV